MRLKSAEVAMAGLSPLRSAISRPLSCGGQAPKLPASFRLPSASRISASLDSGSYPLTAASATLVPQPLLRQVYSPPLSSHSLPAAPPHPHSTHSTHSIPDSDGGSDAEEAPWEWPQGSGPAIVETLMQHTRPSVEAACEMGGLCEHFRATEHVGEVGRMWARHASQSHGSSRSDPSRRRLDLSHSINGANQVIALVDVLQGNTDLQQLLLPHNNLTDASLQPLLWALTSPACTHMAHLDIGHNSRVTSQTVRLLLPLLRLPASANAATSAHASLTHLVLSGTSIGDEGASLLAGALESESSRLLLLDVTRCGLREIGASALGRMLAATRSLQVLSAGWNMLGSRGGKVIALGLAQCDSLTHCHLPWAGLSDLGASHVARALSSAPSLRVLDLSGNNLSDGSAIVLVSSLRLNPALELLMLRDNPLGQCGTRILLRALAAGIVTRVDLMGCSFQPSCKASLSQFNSRDPDGKYELDLSQPAHRQVAVELLAQASQQEYKGWSNASLDRQPFKMTTAGDQQIPSKGILRLDFISARTTLPDTRPVTDAQLTCLWHNMIAATGATTPSQQRTQRAADKLKLLADSSSSTVGSPTNRSPVSRSLTAGKGVGSVSRGPRVQGVLSTAGAGKWPVAAAATAAVEKAAAAVPSGGGGGGGGLGGRSGSAAVGVAAMKGLTDEWLLGLLSCMVEDCFITTAQLLQVLACFDADEAKVEAVMKTFGVLSDPEAIHDLLDKLGSRLRVAVEGRIDMLYTFTPDNPTGRYSLALSHPTHHMVARRLLALSTQQEALCSPPFFQCLTVCQLDGDAADVSDPHKIWVPHTGILELVFSDLRALPHNTQPLTRDQFSVLLGWLVHQECLSPHALVAAIDNPALSPAIGILKRWSSWQDRHPIAATVATLQESADAIHAAECDAKAAAKLAPESAAAAAAAAADPSTAAPDPCSLSQQQSLHCAGNVRSNRPSLGSIPAVLAGSCPAPTPSSGFATPVTAAATAAAPVPEVCTKRSRSRAAAAPGLGLARQAPPVCVLDMVHLMPALHMLAVNHCLTCAQLIQLLLLLPRHLDARVDVCCTFWARVTDRSAHWIDVVRSLSGEHQASLCQRIGYMNVFNPLRSALHYQLRMYKKDEHEICWQLYNIAMTASATAATTATCFLNLTVDGLPKKINQGPNMWTLLRGSAADGTMPTVTLEFDYVLADVTPPAQVGTQLPACGMCVRRV
ncbi:MAG: hypothetical protein WDW38_001744 [Sanguina aurantia]